MVFVTWDPRGSQPAGTVPAVEAAPRMAVAGRAMKYLYLSCEKRCEERREGWKEAPKLALSFLPRFLSPGPLHRLLPASSPPTPECRHRPSPHSQTQTGAHCRPHCSCAPPPPPAQTGCRGGAECPGSAGRRSPNRSPCRSPPPSACGARSRVAGPGTGRLPSLSPTARPREPRRPRRPGRAVAGCSGWSWRRGRSRCRSTRRIGPRRGWSARVRTEAGIHSPGWAA